MDLTCASEAAVGLGCSDVVRGSELGSWDVSVATVVELKDGMLTQMAPGVDAGSHIRFH